MQDGFFSVVLVELNIERRWVYYDFNFVVPITMVSVLNIFGFLLPVESGEKIALRNDI